MSNDTYKMSVGFVNDDGTVVPNGSFVYLKTPDDLHSPGDMHHWHCKIDTARTTTFEHITGVLLLGKPYQMTRFTDHDGTGWVRFTDLSRFRA